MPRFFIPTDKIVGNRITFTGSDAHHISHVLRAKMGEKMVLCDMGRREHTCVITGFAEGAVFFEILSSKESSNEPTVSVTLYQGLPKGDKTERIIQKAVELGVSAVVPVEAERSVVKVNDGFSKKLERYNGISLAAAKQCGRGFIPDVEAPIKFSEAVKRLSRHGFGFICFEGGDVIPIKSAIEKAVSDNIKDFGFYIGPEGGLSQSEIELAKASGIALCGLGKRILRTETASGCVLSVIMLLTGNL